jgi:dTDP-4-dehydrorhamnose reductase
LAQAQPDPPAWLQRRAGVYHLAGDGAASRFEWAKEILEFAPRPDEIMAREIDPAKTEEFPTAAERPLYSALDCSCFYETFGLRLPDWKSALQMAMSQ